MNQLSINLVQAKESRLFKSRDSSSITCYVCKKQSHYAWECTEKGSSSQKNPSPRRRVSFNENENWGTSSNHNFLKSKKHKTKMCAPLSPTSWWLKEEGTKKLEKKIPIKRRWRRWFRKKENGRIESNYVCKKFPFLWDKCHIPSSMILAPKRLILLLDN